MKRPYAVILAIAVVVLSGTVHGMWTDRWDVGAARRAAPAKLAALPMTIGDWEGQAQEMDERQRILGRIDGYVMRQYVNRRNGSTVSLLLVCGRSGPVSVHSPDVCYRGAGYETNVAPAPCSLDIEDAEIKAQFMTGQFRKQAAVPDNLRIFWSWTANGAWSAPSSPRLAFARSPVLYKLYVLRKLPAADDSLEEDPALGFMRLLLPEVQKTLF